MTLTAAGYDGAIIEADWSELYDHAGAKYSFGGNHDFEVTPRTGATLTSNVAAGMSYGCGVKVTSDAQITVTHATPPATGTRWDAVVLRRDWSGDGGFATVLVIAGTSARAVPATRLSGPGVKDDQVLALVPISAGSTLPGKPVDMRWRPSTVVTVTELLAITDPTLGMEAIVLGVGTNPDTRWRYQLDATSNPAWQLDDSHNGLRALAPVTQANLITTTAGWNAGSLSNRALRDRNLVHLDIEVRRSGARIRADGSGNFPDTQIATIDSAFLPDQQVPFQFLYYGGNETQPTALAPYGGIGYLNASGNLGILAGAPGIYINTRTDGIASIRAHISFLKAS